MCTEDECLASPCEWDLIGVHLPYEAIERVEGEGGFVGDDCWSAEAEREEERDGGNACEDLESQHGMRLISTKADSG